MQRKTTSLFKHEKVHTETTDCLIVGAGPVGLTLACRLRQYGVSCRILDKLDQPVKRTKAAAVWSRTAEVFAQMGVADAVVENGLQVSGASFFSGGKSVARLELDSIDSLYNYVLMIAQHVTEQVLREHLTELGVEVEYDSHVTSIEQSEDTVTVTLESGCEVHGKWLVGCDGSHSFVRKSQDLSFDGKELESRWIVGDLHLDGVPVKDELILIMHKHGPTGLFPLGGSLYRAVAETESEQQDAESLLADLVKSRTEFEGLKVSEILDSGFFSIHERQVDKYRVGRVFLAGDAAHVQSPIGGQGMNTGIQDANNLAWKLALVTKGIVEEKLLDTYHEERYPVAEWLVETTSIGTSLVTNKQPLVAAFRPQVARLMAALPMVQNKLRNTLAELDINYRKSSLSQEPTHVGDDWSSREGIRAGERAPDSTVLLNGTAVKLSEQTTDCCFHLLLFDAGTPEEQTGFQPLLKTIERNHNEMVKTLLVTTLSETTVNPTSQPVLDPDGKLHHLYGASEPAAYIIRPDGYIAYRSKPVDQVELLDYLDRWNARR